MIGNRGYNQYTGVYRTTDPIENFKFRVTLKKLYSIIKLPKFDQLSLEISTNLNSQTNEFEEQKEFLFQQKRFSEIEFTYFSLKDNCKTDTDKKYYDIIQDHRDETIENDEELKEKMKIGKIYSYTNEDKYTPTDQIGDKYVKITKLQTHIENSLKSENEETEKTEQSEDIFFDEAMKELVKDQRYSEINNFETMYICADLDPTTLLFVIKYRESDGLLMVYPDFNEIEENPYLLKIDKNSKQLFHFSIENLSRNVDENFLKSLENQKRQEITDGTAKLVEKLSNLTLNMKNELDFNIPKYCRVLVLIEILDGENFEYDNIHVQYEIKIPNYARVIEGETEGSTHSSFKYENKWNFGHCHSITLDIDDELELVDDGSNTISINFELISVDRWWQRERREGLTQFQVSLDQSIICEKKLQCFRDLQGNNKIVDFLERYFFGGIYENSYTVEDIKDGVMNQYGNQTKSTGSINIRVYLLKQVRASLINKSSLKQELNQKFPTIDDVIEEYQKAKDRLEKTITLSP